MDAQTLSPIPATLHVPLKTTVATMNLLLIPGCILSLCYLVISLRRAPEGFEANDGFHCGAKSGPVPETAPDVTDVKE